MAGNTINQKDLIWPSRRKFLQRAPLIFGAVALAAMPKLTKAAALPLRGAANPLNTPLAPPQPTPANTWGYNTLSFWDDFLSPSTIDLNNTLSPTGYNWYVQQYDFQANQASVQPPSAFSVAGSILTFSPITNHGNPATGGAISTAGYVTSPSKSYVGNTINPNGAYFECRMAFNPALCQGSTAIQLWPAFWIWDKGIPLGYANGVGAFSPRLTELDALEAIPNGVGAITPEFTDWDEQGEPCSSTFCVKNTNINLSGIPNLSDFKMHTYGVLWVPQSKNGGTGIIQRWIDGVHYTSGDVSYSSSTISAQAAANATTGWMSGLDTSVSGFTLNLDTGANWPIYVDYVQVWQ